MTSPVPGSMGRPVSWSSSRSARRAGGGAFSAGGQVVLDQGESVGCFGLVACVAGFGRPGLVVVVAVLPGAVVEAFEERRY